MQLYDNTSDTQYDNTSCDPRNHRPTALSNTAPNTVAPGGRGTLKTAQLLLSRREKQHLTTKSSYMPSIRNNDGSDAVRSGTG